MKYTTDEWLFFDLGEGIKGVGRYWGEDISFVFLREIYYSDGSVMVDDWIMHDCISSATNNQILTCLGTYAKNNGYRSGAYVQFARENPPNNIDIRELKTNSYQYNGVGLYLGDQMIYSESGKKWIELSQTITLPPHEGDYHTVNGEPVHISKLIEAYIKVQKWEKVGDDLSGALMKLVSEFNMHDNLGHRTDGPKAPIPASELPYKL